MLALWSDVEEYPEDADDEVVEGKRLMLGLEILVDVLMLLFLLCIKLVGGARSAVRDGRRG